MTEKIKQSHAKQDLPEMLRGDHLISSRVLYAHHGIYLGEGNVIHYAGLVRGLNSDVIKISSITEFMGDSSLKVCSHTRRKYGAEEIVRRALSRLGEDKYHVLNNNCEHFVRWCIFGEHHSQQVESFKALLRVTGDALKISRNPVASAVGVAMACIGTTEYGTLSRKGDSSNIRRNVRLSKH